MIKSIAVMAPVVTAPDAVGLNTLAVGGLFYAQITLLIPKGTTHALNVSVTSISTQAIDWIGCLTA